MVPAYRIVTITPVLLPGNMCDERLWRGGDGVLLEALARPGLSSPVDVALTRDDRIATMAATVLAATHGPLLPIGFSMGAIVALEMAHQSPERIGGAVLLGLNAAADLPERAAYRPMQQAAVRAGGLEHVLVDELKPNYLAPANRCDPALLALLRDMGLAIGDDAFVRQSEALRLREDRRDTLAALDVPVLLGCGLEDRLCPPAWHRQWVAIARDARLVEFAGAGHMLPLEAPHALAAALGQWLDERMAA